MTCVGRACGSARMARKMCSTPMKSPHLFRLLGCPLEDAFGPRRQIGRERDRCCHGHLLRNAGQSEDSRWSLDTVSGGTWVNPVYEQDAAVSECGAMYLEGILICQRVTFPSEECLAMARRRSVGDMHRLSRLVHGVRLGPCGCCAHRCGNHEVDEKWDLGLPTFELKTPRGDIPAGCPSVRECSSKTVWRIRPPNVRSGR
jgi:hypothetical protein